MGKKGKGRDDSIEKIAKWGGKSKKGKYWYFYLYIGELCTPLHALFSNLSIYQYYHPFLACLSICLSKVWSFSWTGKVGDICTATLSSTTRTLGSISSNQPPTGTATYLSQVQQPTYHIKSIQPLTGTGTNLSHAQQPASQRYRNKPPTGTATNLSQVQQTTCHS